jgi:hypothetical protein
VRATRVIGTTLPSARGWCVKRQQKAEPVLLKPEMLVKFVRALAPEAAREHQFIAMQLLATCHGELHHLTSDALPLPVRLHYDVFDDQRPRTTVGEVVDDQEGERADDPGVGQGHQGLRNAS